MNKSSKLYRSVYKFFEWSWVFNLNQIILDPGKKRQIVRFLRDVPYRSMIDIGCGTGNWTELARGRYLGIDTSPSFIEACKRRFACDSTKQFVLVDVTKLELAENYDLAILISVLHHLSDDEVLQLVHWVRVNARYLFILDLHPIRWNPISRWLYAMDRGNHIREPAAQRNLVLRQPGIRLVKEGDYRCPNGLYRHTLFLFESTAVAGH
ncbi:MAG: methyltransferase [Verrucomicrobiia bacterium]